METHHLGLLICALFSFCRTGHAIQQNVMFEHEASLDNKQCTAMLQSFSTKAQSNIQCSQLCTANADCRSFFYSESTNDCTGCVLVPLTCETCTKEASGTLYYKDNAPITCKSGWINYDGSCYFLELNARSRADAKAYCIAKDAGSKLAEIKSSEENTFLKNYLTSQNIDVGTHTSVWIGGEYSNGDWIWESNGESIGGRFWAPEEPKDSDADCITMMKIAQYAWNDEICDRSWPLLCEIEYTS